MSRGEETAEKEEEPLRAKGSEADLLGGGGECEIEQVEVDGKVVAVVLADEVVEVGFV